MTPRLRPRHAGEPADPPRRLRGDRPHPAPRRAAHVPAGRRRQQPRQRSQERAQAAQGVQPRTRRDPHRRRADRRPVDSHHRRLQVHAPVPAGRPVRARRRLPVVRQPGGQHRRRGVVQQRAHRSGHQLAAPGHRRRAQRQVRAPTTSCCRSPQSAQQTAEAALRGQRGSVVALDVQTGAVLAMYSNPTFNPNGLSVHDTQVVQNTFNDINSDANGKPALQRAYRDRYSPGSTFKVVTSKSAIEAGHRDDRRPRLPRAERLPDPGHEHDARQLRRRRRAAARCGRASSTRATPPSPRSATSSATASRRRWSSAASTSAPPIDLAPAAVESVGPRVGRRPGPLRAGRHRPGRRVHLAAADGADRRGHRQRRRDHGTARRAGDPQPRRQDRAHHRTPRTGRRACSRPPRLRSPT